MLCFQRKSGAAVMGIFTLLFALTATGCEKKQDASAEATVLSASENAEKTFIWPALDESVISHNFEETFNQLENAAAEAAAAAAIDYENLVTDAYCINETYMTKFYNEQKGGLDEKEVTASYRIPKIDLPGGDAEKANLEIYNTLYPVVQDAVRDIWEQGYPYISGGVSYRWNVNGDILSVVVCDDSYPTSSGSYVYMVYNFSIKSGEILPKDEIPAAVGLDEDEYMEQVKLNLGSRFWSGWSRTDENLSMIGTAGFFNQQLEKTVSQDNAEEARPYLDENGNISVVAKIYSLAAGDYYWHDLDLIDHLDWDEYSYELVTDYHVPVGAQTHEGKLSEDDACQIACDHWKDFIADGQSNDSEITYFVAPPLVQVDENTGKSYYYITLKWWVDDPVFPHMSTVDWIYIDCETGACSAEMPG